MFSTLFINLPNLDYMSVLGVILDNAFNGYTNFTGFHLEVVLHYK